MWYTSSVKGGEVKRIVIIGGGVSGLSVGYRLKRDMGADVTVLEVESRPGGKAQTFSEQGFTCEEATNGWLDKEPAMRDLVADLGLEERVQPSDDLAAHRFIYRAGRLHELQMHPLKFLTSSALPLGSRLRLIMEPFVRQKTDEVDETLAEFADRRIGTGARNLLIGPMASGVYAGDPTRMSLKSCFGKVYTLEREHGGLIKGMIALKRAKRRSGENPDEVQAGPTGRLTSLKGGVGELTGALAAQLGDDLRCGARVVAVRPREGGGFYVEVEGYERLEADIVISAAPAHAAAAYLASLDEDAAAAFGEIPYPSLDVVCLGFRREQVAHPLAGFGFLVPRGEEKTILGALWTSSIFPGRSPKAHVLVRAMVGGMLEPQVAGWDLDQVLATVRQDLRDVIGIEKGAEPVFQKVFRHPKAIPQYHVGHSSLQERIQAGETRHPGFFATGNALRGIGVIDCVRESVPLAERVARLLG